MALSVHQKNRTVSVATSLLLLLLLLLLHGQHPRMMFPRVGQVQAVRVSKLAQHFVRESVKGCGAVVAPPCPPMPCSY